MPGRNPWLTPAPSVCSLPSASPCLPPILIYPESQILLTEDSRARPCANVFDAREEGLPYVETFIPHQIQLPTQV